MSTLLAWVEAKIAAALHTAFPENVERAEVTQSTTSSFGHYQCNNALKLAKTLGKPPREIAQKICTAIDRCPEIEKVEIAGAGFINIWLSSSYLAQGVQKLLTDTHLGVAKATPQQRILIDYSSPNVAKELHVGHLRSTIIGECLARVFEFMGHEVLRLNHIGDWGTQFGMLIAYLSGKSLEGMDLAELMQHYRESKKLFDADSDFKKRAQQEVIRLQSGDVKALDTWKQICAISRKSYQEVYDRLDVHLIERGESFYNPYLKETVERLSNKGLVTISEGAKCIFLEGFSIPMIIQKSDGGYNYDTTDMAALCQRIEREKADRIIYVTDSGQSLHFQMVFEAAKKAGILDPENVRVDHVGFGVVLGPDGKKFKTRSGETEKLMDLILEAVKKAQALLHERLPDMSEEALSEAGAILGIDAIKYADLSCHRIKDYHFSYERMLRFEGNTAPFLLYAYVRVQGIKRKVAKDLTPLLAHPHITLEHPTEVALALHLLQFAEALEHVEEELLPNRLTDYVHCLAEKFHAFFRDCRVEGSALEESRLLLSEACARTLECGLHLLGLKTLERM